MCACEANDCFGSSSRVGRLIVPFPSSSSVNINHNDDGRDLFIGCERQAILSAVKDVSLGDKDLNGGENMENNNTSVANRESSCHEIMAEVNC